jgi:endonuclease G
MRLEHILKDAELNEEITRKLSGGELAAPFPSTATTSEVLKGLENARSGAPGINFQTETIVRRMGRPVVLVRDNTFEQPQSEVWCKRLNDVRASIDAAIMAVGRIEVREHPDYSWVGTAWIVADEIIVTNRHVAAEFAKRQGSGFVFKRNFLGRQMMARIDFREEHGRPDQEEFQLSEVLHIEDDDGYDMAFFRVEGSLDSRRVISLARAVSPQQRIVVLGYPAKDSRVPDQTLMEQIYGSVYDVKRLAPGEVMDVIDVDAMQFVTHDCTTLGGNSGSVAFDYTGGQAVGLHFGGSYLKANYAVPASVIAERLAGLT